MPTSYRARLGLVLAVGALVRVGLAFGTHGLVFDLQSYVLVDHGLGQHPLHVYALVNSPSLFRWPYLSGFFPLILLTRGIAAITGLAFTSLIRLPAIAGDLAIAVVVQGFLARRRAPQTRRLAAAAVAALG